MTVTNIRSIKAASVAAVLGLAACSGSGTSPQSVTQANVSKNVLQFAVGTANVYGDLGAGGGASVGLNIATTYRQPAGAYHPGDSAVFVNSPTITVPGTLAGAGMPDGFFSTIVGGPASSEVGTHLMTSTAQSGSATSTTFGTSGGVFGLGLAPYNYNEGGAPDSVAPYVVPLYDAASLTKAGDGNAFVPWGGPPAFDPKGDGTGVRDEDVPAGTLGVPEGLDVFAGVTPAAGSYALSVAVPANTGTVTQAATGTLSNTTPLPAWVIPTPTSSGTGGGTFPLTLPAGVTEAYIEITDFGTDTMGAVSCNGSTADVPTYYTILAKASGTYTLPNTDGPNLTPSICTSAQNTTASSTATAPLTADGDQFTMQLVGFDYPWFEASYPNSSGNPAPTIAGANGQSDITISSSIGFTQPSGSVGTAFVRSQLVLHRTAPAMIRRR